MINNFNPSFREFLIAFDFILKWEGHIANHNNDYGGLTNIGITQKAYDDFCKRNSKNSKSVISLKEIDVIDFYWLDRYIPSNACKLPYPLSLIVFDTSVLFSVPASYSFINEYMCDDPEDYSDKGMELLLIRLKEGGLNSQEVALGLCNCREKEHKRVVNNDNSQSVFLDGWLNRLNDLRLIVNKYINKNELL